MKSEKNISNSPFQLFTKKNTKYPQKFRACGASFYTVFSIFTPYRYGHDAPRYLGPNPSSKRDSVWILQILFSALLILGALGSAVHLSLLQVSLAHILIFAYFRACRYRKTDQKLIKILNLTFFKRKVHTFGKKQQPKSKQCPETSAESKRGDTGLSNGTGLTSKLARSTENGRFEV